MISDSKAIIKIITFLLISGAIIDESQAIKKSTWEGTSGSPLPSLVEETKLSPQYIKFFQECERRMSEECADEVFAYILKKKKISHECCSDLVYMGPDCHKAFIDREKELIKNKSEKRKIVSRSEELWKKCEKTVPKSKNKHYPRFPAPEYRPGYKNFLDECAKKMTNKCETEVVDAIFKKNMTVDKDCCLTLLKKGKECHDEVLKNMASYKKNPRKIKAKSEQVWKNCKKITAQK